MDRGADDRGADDGPRGTAGSARDGLDGDLDAALAFLGEAGRLKDTLRSAHSRAGRVESSAEHSWRLCLWALALGPRLGGGVDPLRLLKMLLVHDLGEALHGDVPAPEQQDDPDRAARERADLVSLTEPLPPAVREELLALHAEYEAGATPEARLAKGLDKLETLLTHAEGANPPGFDYAFNLDYGRARTDALPLTRALRERLDRMTRARLEATPR